MRKKLLFLAAAMSACLLVGLLPSVTNANAGTSWHVSAEDGGSYQVKETERGYSVKGSLERGNFAFVPDVGINLYGKVSFDLKFKYDMSNLSFYTPHYMQRSFGFVVSEPVDGDFSYKKFRKLSNSINPGTLIEDLRGLGFMVSKNDDTKVDPLSAVKDFFVQSFYEDYWDSEEHGRVSTGTMVDQVYHLDQTGADVAATMFKGDRPLHVEITPGEKTYRIKIRTYAEDGTLKPENIETSYSVYIPREIGFGDVQYLGIVAQNYSETNGLNHKMNVEFTLENLAYETKNVVAVTSDAVSAIQGEPAQVDFAVRRNPSSGVELKDLTFEAISENPDIVAVLGTPSPILGAENSYRIRLSTNQLKMGKTRIRIRTSEGYETYADVHIHDGSAPSIDLKSPPAVGKQGKKIVLPAPEATDNSGEAQLSVRVVSPEIIELEPRLDGKYEFTPSAYGRYRIEYTARDGGLLESKQVHTVDVAGGTFEDGFDYELSAAGEQTVKTYSSEDGVYVLGGQDGNSVVSLRVLNPIKLAYAAEFDFSSRMNPQITTDIALRRPDKQVGLLWEFYATMSGTCKAYVYETYYSRLKEEQTLLAEFDVSAELYRALTTGETVRAEITEAEGELLLTLRSSGGETQTFAGAKPEALGQIAMLSFDTKGVAPGALSYSVRNFKNTALRALVLPEETIFVKNGETYQIPVGLKAYGGEELPAGLTLRYESSAPEIAAVDESGKVTPVRGVFGRTEITVISPYGDRAQMLIVTTPDTFKFRTERVTLTVRTAEKLDLELSPSNTLPEFLSEDPETVSVRSDGVIHAHKAGRATVTARVGETVIAVVVTVVDDGGKEAEKRLSGGCAGISASGGFPIAGCGVLLLAGALLFGRRAFAKRGKAL